jgi:heme exporter protein D
MTSDPHAFFIAAAYLAGAIIMLALIGWVMLDYRNQRRLLADLEARGVTRRSDRAAQASVKEAT